MILDYLPENLHLLHVRFFSSSPNYCCILLTTRVNVLIHLFSRLLTRNVSFYIVSNLPRSSRQEQEVPSKIRFSFKNLTELTKLQIFKRI